MGKIIAEAAVALLAAGGLLLICWLLFGRMLIPVGEGNSRIFTVVPARGGGEELEHTVNGLLWLRRGDLARFTIVIADFGLNEDGFAAVEVLRRRERGLVFCPLADLEQCIKETTQDGCC